MKSIVSAMSIIALGFVLAGCPGSGGGGSSGTGTASGSFTRVALVPNQTDNTVSVFLVDNANGQLRPRGYVVSGTSPRAVAVHPSGQFFYTINGGSNNVSAHALSATGLATAVTGSPFPLTSGTDPTAVAVSPNGLFLFVANQSSNNISVLSINQTTGALAAISGSPVSLASAVGPTAIAVHPSGNLLFITNNTNNPSLSGTLSVFIIQSMGDLTSPLTPVLLVLNPQALALNETGTVVYVANKGSNSISAFSIDQNTGDLSLIAGQPFPTGPGTAPSSVAVGPGGQFLYVANSGIGTIGLFTIDQVTGALSAVPAGTASATGANIRIDPSGRTLYATDSTLNLVSLFSIDSVSGLLTAAGTRAMKPGPGALAFVTGAAAVAPTPTFAYVANAGDNTLSAFAITPATGAMTPIASSPVSLSPSTNPQSVATDLLGRYLYVVNHGSDDVSAFSIAPGTGILTAIGSPVPTGAGTGPRAVTVEPSGRFAYVVNATTNEVSRFSINQTTGALGSGVVLPVASTGVPRAIVTDPSGRFLYVANTGTPTRVSAYLINAADGSLTVMGSSPFDVGATAAGSISLVTDVFGQSLYVANESTNNVSAFAIDQASGALVLSSFNLAPATSPQSIAVELSGRFAYVVNGSTDDVSVFAINQTTGALSAVAGSPFTAGVNPSAITTVGRF